MQLNTSGKTRDSDIDDETRNLVNERNKPDFDLYNFAADLFDARYKQMLHILVETYGKKLGINTPENLQQKQIIKLLSVHASSKLLMNPV